MLSYRLSPGCGTCDAFAACHTRGRHQLPLEPPPPLRPPPPEKLLPLEDELHELDPEDEDQPLERPLPE